MNRTNNKTREKFLLIIISFICLSFLSSCSVGFLGTYYFRIEGVVQQSIYFDVFNNATLITMTYENGKLIEEKKLKTKWQRCAKIKTDSENNVVKDDKGNPIYEESVNLTYYEKNIKKVIQFYLIEGVLIDYYYNKEFSTYREFRR